VYTYWLSIRRGRDLPPIRDLDPLEISDVAPCSVLLEIADDGGKAQIRHLGAALKSGADIETLAEAPEPSVLSSIAGKIGAVAATRDVLAFQDTFETGDGLTLSSVTLLPFSTTGESVDFVYGFVSVETGVSLVEDTAEPEILAEESEPEAESDSGVVPFAVEAEAEDEPEAAEAAEPIAEEGAEAPEPVVEEIAEAPPPEVAVYEEPEVAEASAAKPGFSSKVFDALAGAKGFFGTVASADPKAMPEPVAEEHFAPAQPEPVVAEEPVVEEAEAVQDVEPTREEPEAVEEPEPEPEQVAEQPAPVAEEPVESRSFAVEGTLQSKLEAVRTKAEEARAAKLRAEAALVEGLSAAYDFALDAENAPEEYLKLVEAQGLKIQLRSPMAPVVKLAFDGSCDPSTIKQLESVLAWALKMELPRGSLAERIESEGGLGSVVKG
jgi:hypothetical protein